MRDTIDMAREVGDVVVDLRGRETFSFDSYGLKAFEALVRADEAEKYKWDVHSCGPTCTKVACVAMREAVQSEREACAKVCDVLAVHPEYASDITKLAASAIRARGEN